MRKKIRYLKNSMQHLYLIYYCDVHDGVLYKFIFNVIYKLII